MEYGEISLITQKNRIPLMDGGELECMIALPRSETLEGMNKFYARVEETCRKFCESRLAGALEDTSHYYRYRLSSEVRGEKDTVRVLIKVTLTDRTAARVLERREMTHIWKYGLLIKAK